MFATSTQITNQKSFYSFVPAEQLQLYDKEASLAEILGYVMAVLGLLVALVAYAGGHNSIPFLTAYQLAFACFISGGFIKPEEGIYFDRLGVASWVFFYPFASKFPTTASQPSFNFNYNIFLYGGGLLTLWVFYLSVNVYCIVFKVIEENNFFNPLLPSTHPNLFLVQQVRHFRPASMLLRAISFLHLSCVLPLLVYSVLSFTLYNPADPLSPSSAITGALVVAALLLLSFYGSCIFGKRHIRSVADSWIEHSEIEKVTFLSYMHAER